MTTKTSVCIAGHTGFVGKNLTAALDGIADIEWVGASASTGIDLTVPGALNVLGACDVVVNLAGRVGVGPSWTEPATYFRDNLLCALSVLDFARTHDARVIPIGSYMYGTPAYQPIDEAHPVSCESPYAASKHQAELICEAYSDEFSIPVTVLRPFNLYGPGQPDDFLVPVVIGDALANRPIEVHHLSPRRDYLWVGDLVSAIIAVIRRQTDGYNVFNVGFGKSHSTREVIDIVLSYTGEREVRSNNTPRANELNECICDNRLFRRTFNWSPSVSLEDGIGRLIDEARRQ